ncbi:hypothetical protein [Olegusella massiliensis]|uniref:hypothetical protein n=1 Tax=Olegusella massiliensis TaxID=1776381 RepID=UPI0023F85CEF|nr:hypothetical protein [Olegusella massiliensis]
MSNTQFQQYQQPTIEDASGIDLEELRKLSPIACVDQLERAAAAGDVARISSLYCALGAITGDTHPFIYESWALVLALRYAQVEAARELLTREVDLLASPRHPHWAGVLLHSDEALTRFALTRRSVTFLLNPMDPTVATEVFRPSHDHEQLCGAPYEKNFDIARCCATVLTLAQEARLSATVFCDLFRASLVRAWHALRHDKQDQEIAQECLTLCHHLLELHRLHPYDPHFGDERLLELMRKMFVPRGSIRVMKFICVEEPSAFFAALEELSWLRKDVELVQQLARAINLSAAKDAREKQIAYLLEVLASAGDMDQVKRWSSLAQVGIKELRRALDAASQAGKTELVAWLLSAIATTDTVATPNSSLNDLLL